MRELPNGWAQSTLGDIRVDRSARVTFDDAHDEEFELFSIPSFPSGRAEIVRGREIGSEKQSVAYNTVLISKINPRINRVWVVQPRTRHRAIASTEWVPFFPLSGVEPRFLAYYMQRDEFREYLAVNVSGVGGSLMRVRPVVVDRCPFVLAPLAEQRRIVAAIEEHLSDLDAAVAALERVRANLKRYRAAVLCAAIHGQLFEADDMPTTADHARSLPKHWRLVRLTELAHVASGNTPKGIEGRARDVGTYPWIKVGDMNAPGNEHTIRSSRGWLSAQDVEDLRVHIRPAGSIIFPKRGGAIATNKKRLLGQPSVIDLNTMALVPRESFGAYLWWWFQSIDLAVLSDGSNIPQINHGDIEPLLIPLPPLAEQHRIVAEVERRLTTAEHTEADVALQLRRAARLRQSILKRAFEGKLVPQDPADEPASVLLERIRAEGAAAPAPRRPRVSRAAR